MKETSTLRRLCFDIKFIWNWSPWTTRGVLETWICLYYLFFVPYQIGFETDVAFTNTYIISYTLDSVLVLSLISRKVGVHKRLAVQLNHEVVPETIKL